MNNMIPNNFALTTLSENPEYFEEVIGLIEEEFHYSDEHSYEIDFAPLVDPLNFEDCYLYVDTNTNKVAAHLAVCIRTMVKNGIEIKVAFIGGIVTSKNYRGINLFKNLMTYAIEKHQKNVALFVLWSEIEGLYEKFQFYRTGGLVETGKRNFSMSERPAGHEKTKFSELSEKDFQLIIQIYKSFNEKHFFTVKRDDKDWSIIRNMSSIDLYLKKNVSGDIDRYFCVNKGRDLTNIIHEISCLNPADYPQLIKDLEKFKMWLPEHEASGLFSKEVFYTAFIKMGNEKTLNEFLKKTTNSELIILNMKDELVEFRFKEKEYHASQKDFLQYIFGPKPLEEFLSYGLSPYIAGADSV